MKAPNEEKEHKKLAIIQSNIRNNQFYSSAYKYNIEKNSNKIREH